MSYYAEKVAALPKPHSLEEQYMYTLICHLAEVECPLPAQNPVWRLDQYWKVFSEIAEARVAAPVVPGYNTVSTDTIQEAAVVADKIKDGTITLIKLATEITTLLLGEGKVTEEMLHTEVAARLLGEGNVETGNLADGAVTKEKLGITFDEEPTEGSENLVTSDGIKRYVDSKIDFSDVNEVGF